MLARVVIPLVHATNLVAVLRRADDRDEDLVVLLRPAALLQVSPSALRLQLLSSRVVQVAFPLAVAHARFLPLGHRVLLLVEEFDLWLIVLAPGHQ